MTINKGSKSLIFTPFYVEIEDGHDFYPGQLCDAHIVYPFKIPHVLELDKHDPVSDEKSTFKIKRHPPHHFIETHVPLKNLKLQQDENFYIYKGKIRPVVVVASLKSSKWNTKAGRDEKFYLCAPLFTFKNDRHDQRYIIQSQAFQFDNLFYLPPENALEQESVARFELMQPIMGQCLKQKKDSNNNFVGLAHDVQLVFVNHLAKFLTGRPLDNDVDGIVRDYSEGLMTAYNESLKNMETKDIVENKQSA